LNQSIVLTAEEKLLSKNKGRALSYLSKNAELLKNREDYDPNFHIEFKEFIK